MLPRLVPVEPFYTLSFTRWFTLWPTPWFRTSALYTIHLKLPTTGWKKLKKKTDKTKNYSSSINHSICSSFTFYWRIVKTRCWPFLVGFYNHTLCMIFGNKQTNKTNVLISASLPKTLCVGILNRTFLNTKRSNAWVWTWVFGGMKVWLFKVVTGILMSCSCSIGPWHCSVSDSTSKAGRFREIK